MKTGTKTPNDASSLLHLNKKERKTENSGTGGTGTRNRTFGKEKWDYTCEEEGDGERGSESGLKKRERDKGAEEEEGW